LELARTLRHLGETQTRIGGWSDHAVSEAIYLTDPDGHGIEIYRDRPRSEWRYPNGTLKMTVDPFDADGVLAELSGDQPAWAGLHPETVIGHMHLQVNDIAAAEDFYVNSLGFDLVMRYGGAATFLSARLSSSSWHEYLAQPGRCSAAC
ncbi:MAG: glyoxalase, partial [Caldilineaceae bacterium]|nr:glyoxalase [Caldilineaceae bacterium]